MVLQKFLLLFRSPVKWAFCVISKVYQSALGSHRGRIHGAGPSSLLSSYRGQRLSHSEQSGFTEVPCVASDSQKAPNSDV